MGNVSRTRLAAVGAHHDVDDLSRPQDLLRLLLDDGAIKTKL